MKKVYVILITFLTSAVSLAQGVVKDPNFKAALIQLGLDKNKNGEIESGEVYSTDILDIRNKGIKDFSGIEYFHTLFRLNISHNQASEINLSLNTLLTQLDVSYNNLTSLNLSKNTMLTSLQCEHNALDSLDLSHNLSLFSLDASHNSLSSLNIGLHNFYSLDVSSNNTTNLDLSKSTLLNDFACDSNQISDTLNLSESLELLQLSCSYNNIKFLKLPKDSKLTQLKASNNSLTKLDISTFKSLAELNVTDNQELNYVCVVDITAANANLSFQKDLRTQWTQDCSLVTAIQEDVLNTSITPTVSEGLFHIKLDIPSNVHVVSSLGKTVASYTYVKDFVFGDSLEVGIYSVIITNSKKSQVYKILKK